MGSETQTQLPATEKIPFIERILEYVLFRFRWVFVVFFLLPVNIVYEAYFNVRNWLIFKLNSAPKAHNRKVAVIQKQVRLLNRICATVQFKFESAIVCFILQCCYIFYITIEFK